MYFYIKIEEHDKKEPLSSIKNITWKKTYNFCGVCEYLTGCVKNSETLLSSNKTERMNVAMCADVCEQEIFTHFGLQVISLFNFKGE